MTERKPAGAKALASSAGANTATRDRLRTLQIQGARRIHAELVRMRDDFATSIKPEKADGWLREVEIYMLENGVLVGSADFSNVPDEALTTRMPGDSWRAFEVFMAWFKTVRSGDKDDFLQLAREVGGSPGDLFLMIAIANAFGKAERLLNQAEEQVATGRDSRTGKRHHRSAQALALFSEHLKPGCSAWAAAGLARKTLERTTRDAPSQRRIYEWAVEDGLAPKD